jgi:hypothetical protein
MICATFLSFTSEKFPPARRSKYHVAEIMLRRYHSAHLCLAYPPAMYHKIKNSIRFVDIDLSLCLLAKQQNIR